jgi:phosphatidylglycerophosphate synthase
MSDTHEGRTGRTMQKVQLAPLWSVAVGAAGLAVISLIDVLSAFGWAAGLLYLGVSSALLTRGLRRRGSIRFGPANAVTLTRSTLVGLVTALVATSFTTTISVPLLIGITVPALALDAVDGWIARRTHTISELGARFDMEVDAFLILALGAYVAQDLGWWVLILGLLRYAYVVAGWALPWLRRTVPPRYWRKVVAAFAGIALALAASELADRWVDVVVTLIALGLLLESFGRDIVWQFLHRSDPAESAIPAALTVGIVVGGAFLALIGTRFARRPAERGQQAD